MMRDQLGTKVRRLELRVPASTSNLGPGFDVIGMALGLYNEFIFERLEGKAERKPEIIIEGEGADILMRGESRTYQALARASAQLGAEPPPVRIIQHNAIPLARGLGGSGTAVLAGIVAAFLFAGRDVDRSSVLDLALSMEGHPDNVTPQTVGGLTVSRASNGHVVYLKFAPPAHLRAVVCIPDRPLDTGLARQVLPTHYSREDVVFNIGGAAMTVAALATGNLEHLPLAMQDRLHQPYRAPLLPGMMEMIEAALAAGSPGAALSGAGSGIFAFAYAHNERAIGAAMERAAAQAGMKAYSLYLPINQDGLQIVDVA